MECYIIAMASTPSSVPVMAGLAAGVLFIFLLSAAVKEAMSAEREITAAGNVACLPHKKGLFGGVETSECRIGFFDKDSDKYYGLSLGQDKRHWWLASASGSDELFVVSGVLRPAAESDDLQKYDIAGVIDHVSSAGAADGRTTIYEVSYRHGRQLSAILNEIHAETGAGYSVGIGECNGGDDNNAGGGGGRGGEQCIRITLEKDAPELSAKIPRQLEGFKVDLRILDR
jgi:hypothetical protein